MIDAPILTRRFVIWAVILVALLLFIDAVQSVLLPFIVGGLLAYFLDPVADRLEARGMGRSAAAGLLTALFFLVFVVALLLVIPFVVTELADFIRVLPEYIARYRAMAEEHLAQFTGEQAEKARAVLSGSADRLAPVASSLAAGIFNSGRTLVNLVMLLIITPVTGFYLLRDWDKMIARIHDLMPRDYADTIRRLLDETDRTISGYLHGMVNVMLLLGLFYIIGLSAVGLNFAVLIGVIGGIAIIIPYIGTIVSGGLAVGMAYLQFDSLTPVLITLGIFTAGQMLEGYVLTPKLVGDKIGLHPLWLIFAMLAGAALFGFVGILLAIPVSAVLGVLVRFAVEEYKDSELYNGS